MPAGELVRAIGAHPCVRVVRLLIPAIDPPYEPAALRHELPGVVDDLAVELDFEQRAAYPQWQLRRRACMDATATRLRLGSHPLAGPFVRQRPAKRREDSSAVRTKDLVGVHLCFQSRKATISFAFVPSGTSSSRNSPTASIVVRTWSTYQTQPSQKLRCCSSTAASPAGSACSR